ncbi:MAG: DUF3604 domain-containing protein [Myxococcales bacterium]|nr:DUF3604 domain-containing protein [Myxococcales bacterium]
MSFRSLVSRLSARSGLLGALILGACANSSEPPPAPEPAPPPLAVGSAQTSAQCSGYRATKNAYFGDLHIHTSYSLDSFAFANRNDPATAYRFARGLTSVPVAAGEGGTTTIPALTTPLDFAAVTDHSEFLSLMGLCDFGAAQDPAACAALANQNSNAQAALTAAALAHLLSPDPAPLAVCQQHPEDCAAGARSAWQRLREAAAAANVPCAFSSFVGYEWTATTGGSNLHRNVIFGSDAVPEVPYDALEYPSPLTLWQALDAGCKASDGCSALTIPHNSNLSNGAMWDTADSPQEREFMIRYQKLVEIYQHKGASECLPDDAQGDPACGFELLSSTADPAGFVRAALARGLGLAATIGRNPLALGIIASTDNHNGTAGDVGEDTWRGHAANTDDTPAERLGAPTFGPGGLAAVWAEQNTREAIFAALARRETYATSGPRIKVRTYALTGVSEAQAQAFCGDPAFPAQLIAAGATPMGGELSASTAPTIFVSAVADQVPLSSFDIVRLRELRTSLHSVTLSGSAGTSFCRYWRDPAFIPGRPTAYYVRVLQQPTARWSSHDCALAPDSEACADDTVPTTIQERAWTSPMFITAPATL